MNNFWLDLPPAFSALAPMADVTDASFREVIAKNGQPDVMWTEFVSADGLFLAPFQNRDFWLPEELRIIMQKHGVASDNPLAKDLIFSPNEQPLVVQFFSRDPGRMKQSAQLAVDLGFAGIDINMGCPAKVIVRQGAGCAMIKEPDQAVEVINAAIEGAAGKIPVSVKTRVGFNRDDELQDWISTLLQTDIAALGVHARTRKDMSKVPARWENITKVVALRDKINPTIKIIGNGDVTSIQEGKKRVSESGADGYMIGRGIFGNPWLFNEEINKKNLDDVVIFKTMKEHTILFNKYLGDTKSFALMRKHYKSYLSSTDLSKVDRQELIQTPDFETAITILNQHIANS